MSSKTLFFVFLPVAALLILALVWDGQGGESVAPAAIVEGPRDGTDEAYDTTLEEAASELASVESLAQDPASDGSAPDFASGAPIGRITGRLIDSAGRGIPNEPVVVGLANDPFVRGDEDDEGWTVVAKAVSDQDGHFNVGAHPNVVLELMAGGNRWARRHVEPVVHADDLRVVLEEGFILEGTIYDAVGLPMTGAHVGAGADSITYVTRADDTGHFKLGPLPAEEVLTAAWAPGHDVLFKGGVSPLMGEITLELEAAPEVTGRVVDSVSGDPVTAGSVALRLDAEAYPQGTSALVPESVGVHRAEAEIDASGTFAVPEGVSFGFLLEAESAGYVPLEYDRYEDRGWSAERSDIVLYMRPTLPVVGTATVYATGAPAPGAVVSLESESAATGVVTTGLADDQGSTLR